MSGPELFARFAYPPNALGYCGPDAADELLGYAHDPAGEREVRALARGFEGAWPYLELIAHANGLADPLDRRVVEAYWLGNRLLDGVGVAALGRSVEDRFRAPAGRQWTRLAGVVEHEPRPHHNFHVFCVYPFVGLLRTGATDQALHVLDRCRVRWGRLERLDAATAVVASSPLCWDGRALHLGPPRPEVLTVADGGQMLARGLAPGDLVACHWDWVCHRLTDRQGRHLRAETAAQLDLVNRGVAVPPPALVLS